jgi:hypothetical protein
LIKENTGIYFRPAETAPGYYRLRWRLLQGEEVVPVRPSWRPWLSEAVFLGEVEVKPWPLVTTLPAEATLLRAEYGPAIQLYGYDLAKANDKLNLTLYWQARAAPENDYYTFVHLVSTSGEIVINENRVPVEWLRPTRGWRASEVLTDTYNLALPADLPPGDYELNVGLYNADNEERLPVMLEGKLQANNQLTLTTVTWP